MILDAVCFRTRLWPGLIPLLGVGCIDLGLPPELRTGIEPPPVSDAGVDAEAADGPGPVPDAPAPAPDRGPEAPVNAGMEAGDRLPVDAVDAPPDRPGDPPPPPPPRPDAGVDVPRDLPAAARYRFRRAVVINRAKVGLPGTVRATLADYPVLVTFTHADLRARANGGKVESTQGHDITFGAIDATTCGALAAPCKLPHEIEGWDRATGALLAWVRLPALRTNTAPTDTTIYLVYGNAGVTVPEENPTGVWDGDFEAVWHLDEDPAGTAPQMRDSTSQSHHATSAGGMTAADRVPGMIGRATDFDNVDDRLRSTDFMDGVPSMTVQAWALKRDNTGDDRIVAKSLTHDIKNPDYVWSLNVAMATFRARVGTNNMGALEVNAANQFTVDTWTAWAYTYDGTMVRMYKNGALVQMAPLTGPVSDNASLVVIGNNDDGTLNRYWNGIIDEVRLSDAARSDDWLATDHASQSAPAAFVTVGAEEPLP